jgi:TonB family protein
MPAGRSLSKTQRPRTGLSLTIVLSAAIHVALFGFLAYRIASDKEDTVVFSPPYSVSLVSGEEPGEGGQDGVEPPSITEKAPPAPPVETETEAVTVPVEKPAEVKKETPKPAEKPAAPAVAEEKKKPLEESKKETTEDLNSAIEKIRKKVEAEEAAKKKAEEQDHVAEKPKDAAATPPPKVPAAPSEIGKTPAPGKPGGGNPYGYDNVFTSGGIGKGVPDADLSAYYNEIWKRIRSVWAIPEGLKSSSLSTVYGIRIDRQGRIVDVWMESGSGNGTFDDSAFRAIKKADPLPPIPDKYTDITMDMGIRFHSDKR